MTDDFLRAAQARDKGGAVEGWVMLPADPGPCELDESGWLLEFVRALHVYIPEAMQSVSWSDFTDGQRSRLKTAYRAMIAAAPSPPTDAINTAEGEAWLAQCEALIGECWQDLLDKDDRNSPADYPDMALITHDELANYMADAYHQGLSDPLPPSPPEPAGRTDPEPVSQRVSGASARNADEGAGAAGEPPHLDAPWGLASAVASPPQAPQDVALLRQFLATMRANGVNNVSVPEEALKRLAAALTPRELTDEEAERGARAYEPELWSLYADRQPHNKYGQEWRQRTLKAIRAAYRAITEEPAR